MVLSLESGVEDLLIPLLIGVGIGIDLSTPVLLIRRGVLLVNTFPNIASANVSFNAGVISVCGFSLVVEFIGGGKIETSPMVRKLNNFWSKIMLLV